MDKFKQYMTDEARTDYIPLTECKIGYLYRIHSRNLELGVFDGAVGFIGIRTKFESRYLFTENHWDSGAPFGTVKPFEEICKLPDDILPIEDELHKHGCDWAKDANGNEKPSIRRDLREGEKQHGKRQGFVDEWADTGERLPDNQYPYIKGNSKLFKFLNDKLKELKINE
jgi:hypothetical protein